MASAPQLVRPQGEDLDPALKAWLDRVIVPALVREFLKEQGEAEKTSSLKFSNGIESPETPASAEGVK